MRRYSSDGLSWYTFQALEPHPLRHAVFTRRGGHSAGRFASLNVGHSVGDDPAAVDSNHRLICQALGLSPHRTVTGRQVHGHGVAVVDEAQAGQALPATDGLVTAVAGLALLLRFADCVPIFLYDPVRRAVGLGHAGWRGTIARLSQELLETGS
ncbi:MAG: laccase domain-containing protein [Chloroflexi bacterium]|nr:laccase domain-containing protein [Chloroflexota bacterium]